MVKLRSKTPIAILETVFKEHDGVCSDHWSNGPKGVDPRKALRSAKTIAKMAKSFANIDDRTDNNFEYTVQRGLESAFQAASRARIEDRGKTKISSKADRTMADILVAAQSHGISIHNHFQNRPGFVL